MPCELKGGGRERAEGPVGKGEKGGEEDKERGDEERMDGSDSGSDELHLGGQVRAKYVYSCGTWPRRVVQKVHCR